MTGPFELEGYDVLEPLGASLSTWRAVDAADGARVTLRRVPAAAAHVAEIRRRAALWGSLPGVRVAAVRDVVATGEDLVVVTELAAGGGVDQLLGSSGSRGSLSAGQVVTLVAPLAATLAAAHERGLVHGRVHARNVVLDDAGRPMLTDCVFGAGGDPRADVAALAGLALRLMRDGAPAVLVATLRAAAAPQSGETSAAALADAVLASAPAEPLLTAPSLAAMSRAAARVGSDSRAPSRWRLTVGVAVVVALAAVAVVASGHRGAVTGAVAPPPAAPAVAPTGADARVVSSPALPRPLSFLDVVRRLETRRRRAFTTASAHALADVDVPGTTLWRHDRRVVETLRASGSRPVGLHPSVRSVHVVHRGGSRAVLRVIDAMSSYDVVDGAGKVVVHHSRRSARAVVMVLVSSDGRWRVVRVSR